MKNNKTIQQWVALNGLLKTIKIVALTEAAVIVVFVIISLCLFFKDPLVVVLSENERVFKRATRISQQISPEDIKLFIKGFLHERYAWVNFSPSDISDRIKPFVKDGLYRKISINLKKAKKKSIKGKSLRQTITDVKVQVDKDKIFAKFFKILIIEDIPLIIKSEMAFKLAKGATSSSNPFGMYINGIIEYNEENK